MEINIGERIIETDDVNIIAVNSKYFPMRNLYDEGHIVICQNDCRKVKCFEGTGHTIAQLEEIVGAMASLFASKGVSSFVNIRGGYLINIDNVREMRINSSPSGLYFLEAEFQNGRVVTLYKGDRIKYAKSLLNQYRYAEREYLEQSVSAK